MLIVDKLADKEKYKEENKITLNPGLMKSHRCVVSWGRQKRRPKSEVISLEF